MKNITEICVELGIQIPADKQDAFEKPIWAMLDVDALSAYREECQNNDAAMSGLQFMEKLRRL